MASTSNTQDPNSMYDQLTNYVGGLTTTGAGTSGTGAGLAQAYNGISQWNQGTAVPQPQMTPPSVISSLTIDELNEVIEKSVEKAMHRMMAHFIERISDDGITIPLEALKRELAQK